MLAQRDIPPESYKETVEAFLDSGAPVPEGMRTVGRWHTPGSGQGWHLVETNDLTALAEHSAEWARLLTLDITPVIEDEEAAKALSGIYGS